MTKKSSDRDKAIWNRLAESHRMFALASQEFLSEGVDRVTLIRSALKGRDKHTAIYMLPYLKVEDLKQLFNELIFLASFAHGAIQAIRDVILSLPREWVLAHIEEAAGPLLQDESDINIDDTYRRLLELYSQIDQNLTLRLARRAAAHSDPDTREAGEEFLRSMKSA